MPPSLQVNSNTRDRVAANRLLQSRYKPVDPATLPELENTTTTKNILRLEGIASKKLKLLTAEIKRTRTISQRIESLQRSVIRRLVQDSYWEGVKYVARFARTEPYFTDVDIRNITSYARQYDDLLTSRMYRFVLGRSPELKDITDTFIVDVLASSLTTNVLYEATISKAQQIILNDVSMSQFMPNRQQPRLVITETAAVDPNETVGEPIPILLWRTARDDRVCFYCAQYEMFMVPVHLANFMPTPHQDTHPHCRCRILLTMTYLKI